MIRAMNKNQKEIKMSRIVAVRKDETGSISAYKLDDGRVLSRYEAVDQADAGNIDGVASFTTRDGDKSVRSNAGQADYKLSDLPEF